MFRWMSFALLALVLSSTSLLAQEHKLGDAQIIDALSGKLVKSDQPNSPWSQYFSKNGKTEYSTGSSPTHGTWKAEGGQYCSVWPPFTIWACYDVLQETTKEGRTRIIWVSDNGARTTGLVEAN